MTGTIAIFDDTRASGVISAEDGLQVPFDSNAVLAYDATGMTVGQSVTFDIPRGNHPKAFNVCVDPLYRRRPGVESHDSIPPRYIGFEHRGNLRLYSFARIVPGEGRTTLVVNADLALFAKHHVGIQEGPALCLRLLVAALDVTDVAAPQLLPPYVLTDREMLAYLASRPVPGRRAGSRNGAKLTPPFPIPAHV